MDTETVLAQARVDEREAICQLETIAEETNAEDLLISVFSASVFSPAGAANELSHGDVPVKLELLAYYLFPKMTNLQQTPVTPHQSNDAIGALERLHLARNRIMLFAEVGRVGQRDHLVRQADDLAWRARMDALLVRGSAYPEQIATEIEQTLGQFNEWFDSEVGISPRRAIDLLWSIVRHHEEAFNEALPEICSNGDLWKEHYDVLSRSDRRELREEDLALLGVFSSSDVAWSYGFSKAANEILLSLLPASRANLNLDPAPSEREWTALIALIGFTAAKRSQMRDPNDMIQTPVIVLNGERLLCGCIGHALDQLRLSLETAATRHHQFF